MSRPLSGLLTASLVTAAFLVPLAGQAAAAPGTPGVPQPPVSVFTEDFENGQGANPILVTGYTGAPPANATYTADPQYLTACNGWLTSQQNSPVEPPGAGCGGFWSQAIQLSSALGQWNGTGAATNHAVIAYTSADPGTDKIQLETTAPIPLTTSNRFLTFSVDAAARACFANPPELKFFLLDGETAIPAFDSPINPCAAPQAVVNGTVLGTYFGDAPILFSGDSVGLRLVNGTPFGYGNDGAFDNIRIQDVTPQLDNTFSAATAEAGTSVTLSFTTTNTTELAAKNGWSFTGTLPAGLVADPATVATDCAGGTAAASTTSVSAEANLSAGQAFCTTTVQVTAAHAGTYTTCAANVVEVVGVDKPGCASVRFTPPVLMFDAHAHGGSVVAPLVGVAPLIPSDLSCTVTPGSDSHSLLNAPLPTLGSLGVLTTSASGTIDPAGLRTASAQATTANVRLLAGLITADAVSATATATEDDTGHVNASGSAGLVNLRVAGVPVVNPAVNTAIVLPLVGSVVVNERSFTGGGSGVRVNALHVTLLSGIHVVVSHARVSLLRPSDPCPAS